MLFCTVTSYVAQSHLSKYIWQVTKILYKILSDYLNHGLAGVFILIKKGLCSKLCVHMSLLESINNICTYVCVCVWSIWMYVCVHALCFYVLITVVGISYINNHYWQSSTVGQSHKSRDITSAGLIYLPAALTVPPCPLQCQPSTRLITSTS